MADPRKTQVQIIDSTLREGRQHGGVDFSLETSVNLAQALDAFGVDMLEVGHPVISAEHMNVCRTLSGLGLNATTVAHARAREEDVRAAAECGADWVGIFVAVNEDAEKFKLNRDFEDILELVSEAVTLAKSLGLGVRLTCEDASRTPMKRLMQTYRTALNAGADRLSYADTVGILTPHRAAAAIRALTRSFGACMHIHCHNDLGMAVANTLAGFEGGAVGLDASLGGIGERCGIAPLEQLSTALCYLYRFPDRWRLERLNDLSRLLDSLLPDDAVDTRPVIGKYAFAHKAGLHINAAVQCPGTYEPFAPNLVGAKRRVLEQLSRSLSVAEIQNP